MNSTHLHKPKVTWLPPWKLFIVIFFKKINGKITNLAQGLKNGRGRLVNTILISNLTRLIH